MSKHPRIARAAASTASLIWFFAVTSGCEKPAAAPAPAPPPFEVNVQRIESRDLEWTPSYLAQTSASRAVELRARVQGVIIERLFTEGRQVREGDVLLRIDPRPYQATLDAAKARVEEARARIAETDRAVLRKRQLVESEAVARKELDDALTAQSLAAAQLARTEAELSQAALNLEYTTITAPFSGRIGKTFVEPGSMVDSGSNSLLVELSRVDPLYVSFHVSEREILETQAALESGALALVDDIEHLRIAIELIDGKPYAHEGTINFRSVDIDPATGTAEVRAVVPNPDELLKPGQFVRARGRGWTRKASIAVPQRAVMLSGATAMVYVVGQDDTVEARPVTVARWQADEWLVQSGLASGERVIVDGLMKIRPGGKVKPVEKAE
ncbi:MAG: efflux RND transporter periplasmic adaptor subunit [Planctomycetes bacterium]|nr:efflux RND transporter periplasmic adaptor subunit [Planctomycetota bacterium]